MGGKLSFAQLRLTCTGYELENGLCRGLASSNRSSAISLFRIMAVAAKDLRDRARQCREMAKAARDEPMRSTLERMAREMDEEAHKIEEQAGHKD
jgi:hypothetical protein